MKNLVIVLALAALGGCATYYPAPAYYGSRTAAPGQWQTVSVTPVPNGTAAAAGTTVTDGTTTVVQPVYSAPPVYVDPYPYPYYYAPDPYYWWPPVSIGLGFGFSNCCHHFRGGGFRGGFHGGVRAGGGVRHR